MCLIAQKKRPDALDATQKPTAFYIVRFLKNSIKTSQKLPFFSGVVKNEYFYEVFLDFFINHTL